MPLKAPPRPGPAPGTPIGERLSRIETLIEVLVERQEHMHDENVQRHADMARETKEHRHRTANALQDVTGRLAKIDAAQATQAAAIADILDVKAPAAAKDREDLRDRLEVVESIVSSVKMSWKVVGAIAVVLGAIIGVGVKLAGLLGWKP